MERKPRAKDNRAWKPLLLSLLLLHLDCYSCLARADENADDKTQQARRAAKPWFSRNINVGGVRLPVSWATLIISVLTVIYSYGYIWCSSETSYYEASHILVEDPSEETKAKMEEWKKKINNNYALFAQYAKEHSKCPSRRKGGQLGKFPRNAMAAPFDSACFDPKTPVGTAIGPIRTQFGMHLIFIQERKIA